MRSKLDEIFSERTLVALTLAGSLVGGIGFCTRAYGELEDMRVKQAEYQRFMERVDHRLSHIEGKLGIDPHE